MMYPTLETFLKINKFEINEEESGVTELLALCISEVITQDEQYSTKDLQLEKY